MNKKILRLYSSVLCCFALLFSTNVMSQSVPSTTTVAPTVTDGITPTFCADAIGTSLEFTVPISVVNTEPCDLGAPCSFTDASIALDFTNIPATNDIDVFINGVFAGFFAAPANGFAGDGEATFGITLAAGDVITLEAYDFCVANTTSAAAAAADMSITTTFDCPTNPNPLCDPCGFDIKDYAPIAGKDCVYLLKLFDLNMNGWDGASVDVSVGEASSTNYKVTTADGTCLFVPLYVNDGEFIDLEYWNGAFESEHNLTLYDALGNIVTDVDGNAVDYAGNIPANEQIRIKADCPLNSCKDGTEDFSVRITMGTFPEEQSWEIYEGQASSTAQGAQVISINATVYTGLAPGFQINYPVTLDKCNVYTFVGFDGFNDGWNGGTWELITANLNYGTEILNPLDINYGESLVLGPVAPGADETRTEFTIPCENSCEEVNITDASTVTCATTAPIVLPIIAPEVCYPDCYHAQGCDLTVQHTVLAEGLNGGVFFGLAYAEISGSVVTGTGATFPSSAAFDGDAGFGPGVLPVGCHKYVTEYTYCDGVVVKCTADLNIVTQTNPSMTCNDNVIVSLAAPSSPFGPTTLGECIVRVTPDMVLEMPATNCFGIFEEYKVTVLGSDGQPIVQLGPNGLPLDAAGNEIPTEIIDREPANNFIGPDQLMETITYVVEHKFSGNKCWGTITVEDKIAPVISCVDYDVPCTHPEALNEFWTHTDVYTPSMELPANIAGGTGGLQSNTFIPINLDCAPMGEIIQDIQVSLNLTHNDVTDLSVVLHLPAALDAALGGISPLQLDTNGDVGTTNIYTPNPTNDAPSLLALLGAPCMLTPSTSPEDFITENSGNNVPANAGGTWYIQVIDNNATFPTPPFGGGEVTAASITLTCGFPFPYAAFDCSLEGVELIDEAVVETNCDQTDWNGSVIERVWQATDKFGRTSVCTQTVGLKAPTFDQIAVPADASIECGTEILAADGSIDPAQSGGPRFSCFELTEEQHGLCDISYTYEDLTIGTCGNGFKVIRTWTIVNWCSGVNTTYEQTIKVEDTQGPSIAQEDVAAGTDAYDCAAGTVTLADLGIEDACSGVSSVTATYTQGGGSYIGGGQLTIVNLLTSNIEDLPMGMNQVLITAKDGCLNVTEKLITITVMDNTAPVAICDDQLHVSLGGDGTARLFAEDVDEGSYDNCSEVTLEVRRVDGCLGTSAWGEFVGFACCDVDEFVTVELRVTDAAGNTNVCWKDVLVEDALSPVITAPADKTINCDDAAIHAPFGEATAIDNCTASLEVVDGGELDQCKAGVLTRTWTASDGSEKSADVSATQRVTVEHVSDFVVQFPSDVTISTCPDDLGATGEPSISDDDCELLAISSEDLVLTSVEDACYRIERTWTIVNWCIYEEGSDATALGFPQPLPRTFRDDDGFFQYVQIINVLDNDAPMITNPGNQTFCDLTEGCEGQADLVLAATDGCSNDDALEYVYKIDAFNDGDGSTFDIVGEGNDASGVYPYGTHLIKWIVEDGCGNTSSTTYLFTVEDCKNPTPVCLNGISLPGMNSDGCVELWASDLLEYAFDNCSSDEFVEGSVRIRREGATTAPQSVITLCCDTDGVGTVLLEVWVEDEAGNADFCTTYAILQDPNGICGSTDDSRMIAGDIGTEQGEMVEEVMVDIDGNNGMSSALPTGVNGHYAFPNLVTGVDYTVTPVKDVNPTNGVSTYDLVLMSQHILGVNELTSPYALIAADVNNDGNVTTFDVVQNRQLILYVITDFPSNTSWRFVDADYTFPVSSNPWMESFPEAITVNNLNADDMTNDFVAIKVGDVNGDAVVNSILGTEDRNKVGTLNIEVEDAKVSGGNTVSVDFRASDFNAINGYQFTLNFDASAMNLAGVEKGALNVTEGNFGLSMLNEGVITTSWNADATSVAKDAVLFTLNFDITNEVVLSEAMSISSRYTTAEAYTGTDLMDVALVFNTENGAVAGTAFELYQNTPNPFTGETVIGFSLPTAAQATLRVMDVSGRVLNVVEGDFSKGYNTINLNSADLNAAGVLYYQLETASNSATMKMIILE